MARLLRLPPQNQSIFCSDRSIFNRFLHRNPNFANPFLSLLPFCRKIQDLKALNSLLIVNGLINQQPILKQFIERCCQLGFPDSALSAFKTVEKSNLDLQNLIIRSLCDKGLFKNVILVYRMCHRSGFFSDNYTYPFVIKACACSGNVWFGRMMHSVVLRSGFGENLVVKTSLVDFYSKIGEMGNAQKLFGEIPNPDLAVWNALISGYSVNGLDDEVFEVFKYMLVMGVMPNVLTFASVIPVCSRFDVTSNFGTSVHGLAYKLGCCEDETLTPALISMYAYCGDLLAARSVFDESTRKSVAIWNAMISAYTRNQEPKHAISVYRMMVSNDLEPNMVTFVSLLPSMENLGSISNLESLHAYVLKLGFEKQSAVTTALLSLYAKLGNIDSAEFLFHTVSGKNLLLWNSMVSGYACNGLWEKSLNAFFLMQRNGFRPDFISIISLLSTCAELQASLLGRSAHAFSLKNGIFFNLNVSNALLAFYSNCGELAYSFRIFSKMILKNVISWNTMISGCINNGEPEEAMRLFKEMRHEGVNFDLVTLISILPSCHDYQNPVLGSAIHSYAIRTALIMDISLANALISMYISCEELDAARLLFDNMPYKSVVSYNAILTGLRCHNLQEEVFELFNQMIEDGQKPNYVTLLNLLSLCQTYLHGKSVHAYIFRRRMIPLETPLLTSLMIMYARFEDLTLCMILFHMGDKRNISLWNAVISAYLLSKNSSMAFFFFCELLREKIEPDEVTVLNLISACVQLNNLRITDSVLAYLVKKGFDKDVAISNALIDLYAKCGHIFTARALFDFLQEKDTISWSVMINACGMHGDAESALSIFSQMRLSRLKPDKATYMSILSACSHAGFVEQGRMIFDFIIHDGVFPSADMYACMVDLLGRKGHLNEAYEIIKGFPYKAPANLLESLLGACLSHGNYGLGEEIGRLLLEMNPGDSRSYVMLYNTYAASGRWFEANNVRFAMEQKQFSKVPGVSLLDGVYEPT